MGQVLLINDHRHARWIRGDLDDCVDNLAVEPLFVSGGHDIKAVTQVPKGSSIQVRAHDVIPPLYVKRSNSASLRAILALDNLL